MVLWTTGSWVVPVNKLSWNTTHHVHQVKRDNFGVFPKNKTHPGYCVKRDNLGVLPGNKTYTGHCVKRDNLSVLPGNKPYTWWCVKMDNLGVLSGNTTYWALSGKGYCGVSFPGTQCLLGPEGPAWGHHIMGPVWRGAKWHVLPGSKVKSDLTTRGIKLHMSNSPSWESWKSKCALTSHQSEAHPWMTETRNK